MIGSSGLDELRKVKFSQWLLEYEDAVMRICFLYLSDRFTAEDALQDTFVKVWRSMVQFEQRGNCSPKTWITRIAINTCKDYKRSSWFRHKATVQSLEDLPLTLCAVSQESREMFIDVLCLPIKYRQAIILYHYQNMTMDEAAQILHISRQALSRRLQKAYALLRYQPEGSGFEL